MKGDSDRNERFSALVKALDLLGEDIVSITPAYHDEIGRPYEGYGDALTVTIRRTPGKE